MGGMCAISALCALWVLRVAVRVSGFWTLAHTLTLAECQQSIAAARSLRSAIRVLSLISTDWESDALNPDYIFETREGLQRFIIASVD